MSAIQRNLSVNKSRLWNMHLEMAKIGPGVAGGNNRQALTDDDRMGRDLFKTWCEAANMTVSIDTMGNMFARRAGTNQTLPPVLAGSHLDTQPSGGRFDGVFGVLAALEAVQKLRQTVLLLAACLDDCRPILAVKFGSCRLVERTYCP